MNFAVIENNKIINIIIAESLAVAEEVTGKQCVDFTSGWDYTNGIDYTGFFSDPVEEEFFPTQA